MQNKIPDLSALSSFALKSKGAKLNNQKILFDKKVQLMPVKIEKKTNKYGRL